jgi:hypothetical protein
VTEYTGWLITREDEPGAGGGGFTTAGAPPFPVGEGQPESENARKITAPPRIIVFFMKTLLCVVRLFPLVDNNRPHSNGVKSRTFKSKFARSQEQGYKKARRQKQANGLYILKKVRIRGEKS